MGSNPEYAAFANSKSYSNSCIWCALKCSNAADMKFKLLPFAWTSIIAACGYIFSLLQFSFFSSSSSILPWSILVHYFASFLTVLPELLLSIYFFLFILFLSSFFFCLCFCSSPYLNLFSFFFLSDFSSSLPFFVSTTSVALCFHPILSTLFSDQIFL